jgi:hypothetical protein
MHTSDCLISETPERMSIIFALELYNKSFWANLITGFHRSIATHTSREVELYSI